MCMKRININLPDDILSDLDLLMRMKQLKNRSDAIRAAISQAALMAKGVPDKVDFKSWQGAALKAPLAAQAYCLTEDDLW